MCTFHSKCIAKEVDIELFQKTDSICLSIWDDGKGIQESKISDPHSYGIRSMRERIHAINGDFQLSKADEKGNIIQVRVPIKTVNAGAN